MAEYHMLWTIFVAEFDKKNRSRKIQQERYETI